MEILLANPRGFCAGVDRAIEIVERALELFGPPIYVRHEIVHNRFVVDGLRKRGAIFVEELDQIPDGATVVFSAHGVAREIRAKAEQRSLRVFDATCPLVTKVHLEVVRHAEAGRDVILIGHRGHPEVVGTLGQFKSDQGHIHLVESLNDAREVQFDDNRGVAYVTQTTLSVDDTSKIIAKLKERFPDIRGPKKDDICYATQNRQDAVKLLAQSCDLVLVVGSRNSSNSNRLREIASSCGTDAYLIDGPEDIDPNWLEEASRVGLTAGASAPEELVKHVIMLIEKTKHARMVQSPGVEENVVFTLPKELRP